MKRFLCLLLFVCAFASQVKADVPPVIWYRNFGGSVSSISLHPSGNYLLVGGISDSSYTASIVNPADGTTIKGYVNTSTTYSKFSTTGKYVGLGGWRDDHQNGQITLIDYATDSILLQKLFERSPVYGFDISPDETKLIVGRVGWIEFYNIASGAKTDSIKFYDYQDQPQSIYNLTYSPDGKYIAFSSKLNGGLVVIDAITHKQLYTESDPLEYSRLRFSPDGKLLAFNSVKANTAMEILNLDSMKVVDAVGGYSQSCADIIFTKDSKNILFSGNGSLAYLKKYNLNLKDITTISENWNGYRFLFLSNSNDTLFSSVSSILLAEKISSYLGVEDCSSLPQLTINLNTAQDTLNLSFATIAGKELTIKIVNIEGQVVKSFSGYSTGSTFTGAYSVSDLASGTYILTVSGNGISGSSTFNIAR